MGRAVLPRPAVYDGPPYEPETVTAKVGFVFECGPDGPDYQVCKHFLNRLNPQVEMDPVFMDNAGKLRAECGPPTAALLETCERVVIVWDLTPAATKTVSPQSERGNLGIVGQGGCATQ